MKEGSRHEKAALVIFSYIIGFVTAFIGAGVAMPNVNDGVRMTASVGSATLNGSNRESEVVEKSDGLYYFDGQSRVLLTAKESEKTSATLREGVYAELVVYELSPDKSQVYFCEKPTITSTSCAPYIYSVQENKVYPVTKNGDKIGIVAKKHRLDWSESGLGAIAGMSIDPVH